MVNLLVDGIRIVSMYENVLIRNVLRDIVPMGLLLGAAAAAASSSSSISTTCIDGGRGLGAYSILPLERFGEASVAYEGRKQSETIDRLQVACT